MYKLFQPATKQNITRTSTKYSDDPTTMPLNRGVCREKRNPTPLRSSERKSAQQKAVCRTTYAIPKRSFTLI
jgi:hypothetical protein